MEPRNDRTVAHGRRNLHRRDLRRIDWSNGETVRGEADALHWPVFWCDWDGGCRSRQGGFSNQSPGNGRLVARIDPNHFALEHFHAGGPKHDDSPRQRARTGRVAGRPAKYAFNHFHYRTVVVPPDLWMVHRCKKSESPAGSAFFSRGGVPFHSDAYGNPD